MSGDPAAEAAAFVDAAKEVPDRQDGAGRRPRHRRRAPSPRTPRSARRSREACLNEGTVRPEVLPDKVGAPTKFELYYDFEEAIAAIPSHRFLAVRRGEQEGVLRSQSASTPRPLRRGSRLA
jgi:uncharacterized protein